MLLTIAAIAPDANAGSKVSELLGTKAQTALAAQKFDEAISLLEQALQHEPGAKWTIELARAQAASGRVLLALDTLREAMDVYRAPLALEKIQAAFHEIGATAPTVSITVTGPALRWQRVSIDGKELATADKGLAKVDPGPHTVTVSAPGYRSATASFLGISAKTSYVALALQPEESVETLVPSEGKKKERSWNTPLAIGSASVAGISTLLGVAFYLQHRGVSHDADAKFDTCNSRGCSHEERETISSLDQRAAQMGNWALASASIAVAAGGVAVWLVNSESVSVGVSGDAVEGSSGVEICGRF